ncbi:MAG: bifunctional UDP-N-acetylglucosamine diphosphorylase/glucosamine-1-phosphate N-acetyltransferase GlmU [Firmicutes bacterium]|nr:bifunctional UDP-N-acetylglucosamine diphosphorylase/glucosamine-1-phosphate N-acetyltransferase GlmU [Bacillota bacterium]
MEKAAVVLAAGHGTRMRSNKAKVLHEIWGKPMIAHVVETYLAAGIDRIIVVVGHQGAEVEKFLQDYAAVEVVWQREQLGTGHAVMQARQALADGSGPVLVGYGDSPLYRPETLAKLFEQHEAEGAACTCLSAIYRDPTGYGRIVRDEEGNFAAIVEEKDADPEQKKICEINTGVGVYQREALFACLEEVNNDNAQGEYYLTDVPAILRQKGQRVALVVCPDPEETLGINTKVQLAEAAAVMRTRVLEELMLAGVSIIDPATTYIDADVKIAPDTVIYPFTIIQGKTRIDESAIIGPHTRIVDCEIGAGAEIVQSTLLESKVGRETTVGPYAYLRPNSVIGDHVRIGDFVEIKNSNVADYAKIPHLSYVGDADVGVNANVGAGTITCNFDGERKHRTVIADNAFIGSNSNLVAPVSIGEGAYIAAGSTITKDVPAKALGIGRSRQSVREGWVESRKKK